MNHLHMLDNTSELVLDSNAVVGHMETNLSDSFTEARGEPVDLAEFKGQPTVGARLVFGNTLSQRITFSVEEILPDGL